MADTGSGNSVTIEVPANEAALLFDTNGEVWGITLFNIDAVNTVYISQDRLQLNSSGTGGNLVAPQTPNVGIPLAPVTGSWTAQFFRGRMFARSVVSGGTKPSGQLRMEVWPVYMFDPKIFTDLMAVLKGMADLLKKDPTK